MNTLLVTLNSKFSHASLALRCLRQAAPEAKILECTVNQPPEEILRQLLAHNADVYAFSVYIFNVSLTRRILSDLRKSRPDCILLCGGPEVSYSASEFLRENPAADAILRGEGEETFPELMRILCEATDRREALANTVCPGVTVRCGDTVRENPDRPPVCDLDRLPFPYRDGELEELSDRILYYESSRGCPFTCIYCLSSVQGRVRAHSLQRVFADLQRFLDAKVRLVKLVDRTFNFDRKRSLAVWQYLKEHDNGVTSFHFEIAAWLLGEEEISLLESAREGLFLLEVGIQSTNPQTLEAITRRTDPQRLYATVARLSQSACHVHADLIAGLPYEDLASFEKSFNTVFALRAHCLQLGFLKRLKGTRLCEREDGAQYSDHPPYEILRNGLLSPDDLSILKGVEKMLDKYWNSGLCRRLLGWLSQRRPESVFAFLRGLSEQMERHGEFYLALTPPRAFARIAEWIETALPEEERETANALLCYDRFFFDRCHSVDAWQTVLPQRDRLLEVLKSETVPSLLSEAQREIYRTMNPVQWYRNAELAVFPCAPDGTPEEQTHLFLYGPLRTSLRLPNE